VIQIQIIQKINQRTEEGELKTFSYIALIVLMFLDYSLSSQEIPSHLKRGNFGFLVNPLGNNDLQIPRLNDQFIQKREEKFGRGSSIAFFYNFQDYFTFVTKFYNVQNSDREYSSSKYYQNYGQSFGVYEFHSKTYRPDLEISVKYYPFHSNFYVAPLVGSTGPRSVRYSTNELYSWSAEYSLSSFEFIASPRFYAGIDAGFTFSFFGNLLFSIGYSIKYATIASIDARNRFTFNDLRDSESNLIQRQLLTYFLTQDTEKRYANIRDGATTLYIELGGVF
jgi:hypothetical protein